MIMGARLVVGTSVPGSQHFISPVQCLATTTSCRFCLRAAPALSGGRHGGQCTNLQARQSICMDMNALHTLTREEPSRWCRPIECPRMTIGGLPGISMCSLRNATLCCICCCRVKTCTHDSLFLSSKATLVTTYDQGSTL